MVAGSVDSDTQQFTINGLLSITEYTIVVYSVSGTGSLQTLSEAATTTTITKEIVLDVLVSSTSLVILGWREPQNVGDFTDYEIEYAPDDGEPGSGERFTRDPNPGTLIQGVFSSLTAGQEYTFTLFLIQGSSKTQIDILKVQTEPNSPENLVLTQLGPNGIDVTWERPISGNYDGFELMYGGPNGVADGMIESPLFVGRDENLAVTLTGLNQTHCMMLVLSQ
ncbi:fibronectin-like [Saccoglossus kowalevskii]